ncbi:serine beta-lactamase-like protein LACTB, mitochondrial [Carcharodon carcharias]|uniref:serine beta-lactamase-like protein LACTB, mitochondrial n=1 Tax=Carcharodon carcharias TaxID=13397 RepID=UPI001B7F238F|nr:serine beta-lactamase-like protein LACTB, mitochondrial [Carcharodon carcharias]
MFRCLCRFWKPLAGPANSGTPAAWRSHPAPLRQLGRAGRAWGRDRGRGRGRGRLLSAGRCLGLGLGFGLGLTLSLGLGPRLWMPQPECQSEKEEEQRQEASEALAAAKQRGRDLLQRIKDEVGAPGIVVGVAVDGKEVWSEGLGYADVENRVLCNPDTVMRIASISKPLTMTAIAKLWEDGKLDFDAPVQKYVPEFPEKEYKGEKVTITIRQLLSHLSGIRHYEKDIKKVQELKGKDKRLVKEEVESKADQGSKDKRPAEKPKETLENTQMGSEGDSRIQEKCPKSESDKDEDSGKSNKTPQNKKEFQHEEYYITEKFESVSKSLALFKNDPLMFKPGSQFLYSTHAWTLLSAVVEKASEQNFLHLMKKMFQDLGMLRTVPDEHEPIVYNRARYYVYNKNGHLVNSPYVDCSYKWAGGGFLSTVCDLLRFGSAMLYSYQAERLKDGNRTLLPGYLTPATMRMIWSPVGKTELSWDREGRYAMGWGIVEQSQQCGQCRHQRHYLTHTGGAVGASSVLLLLPEEPPDSPAGPSGARVPPRGVVVAILCNLQSVGLNPTALNIALEFEKVRTAQPPCPTSDPDYPSPAG